MQSGGGGLGTKTADQEDDAALPVFFSRLWLHVFALWLSLSAGRRISDVIVGNGVDDDCTSVPSLSSQRSIISGDNEPARSDDALAFIGAVGGVVLVVVGLVKKEESFDCPALSFFGFDPPAAVDVPVRERLRDSWDDSCDSLREEV